MIDVKRPVLLDASLQPVRALNAENVDLVLNSPGVSQVTITLPPNEDEPPVHSFVEVFNQNGFVGVFRVAVPTTDYTRQHSVVARHGIDTLADSVFPAQTEFSGTVAQYLAQILSFQTATVDDVAFWQLGTCECASTIKKSLNYDRLSDLLPALEEEFDAYYFEYDQTAFPWTLHFKAKPSAVGTEFRLGRNVRALSRTLNDNDLCTRLILSVNVTTTEISSVPTPPEEEGGAPGVEIIGDSTTTETVIRTYDNLEAQEIWGIIQRTADIDTHDDIANQSFPEADAWAQKFLSDHANPSVQMQIDGDEWFAQTGDSLDEARLGYLCAVPLPDYGRDFTLRIVSVRYPNILADPAHVTASLSTQLPRFSSSISSLKKAEAATAKAARSVARSAAKAAEMKQWSMVVTDQQLALDGTGIMELYESGISMDAQGGVKIYSLAQGLQSLYSGIEVQAGRIDLVVQGEGTSAYIKISAIVDDINRAGSSVAIGADHITLDGNTSLSGQLGISNGALLVKTQAIFGESGNLVTINNGKVSAETVQINSTGSLKFGDGTGYGYRTINSATAGNLVTGFGTVSESQGQISIPFYSVAIPAGSGSEAGTINFNIAATQYYIDSVAAAEKSGWNGAAAAISFPGVAVGEHLTDTLVIPDTWTATDAQGPTKNIGLRLEKSATASASSAVTAQYSENGTSWTKILRINVGNFYTEGQNSVNISQAASWQNGVMVVSTDSPIPKSTNVSLPSFSGSGGTTFDANHRTTVNFTTPSVNTPLVSYTVDASAVYAEGQAAATFDISKLTINLGSDTDPTAQVPTKTADRISGKIGVWYDGTYIGELRTFSLSINHGTPYINNHAQGYIRGAVSINGETLVGSAVKLTEDQISTWGGPIT